jgi:hypothetical protein
MYTADVFRATATAAAAVVGVVLVILPSSTVLCQRGILQSSLTQDGLEALHQHDGIPLGLVMICMYRSDS